MARGGAAAAAATTTRGTSGAPAWAWVRARVGSGVGLGLGVWHHPRPPAPNFLPPSPNPAAVPSRASHGRRPRSGADRRSSRTFAATIARAIPSTRTTTPAFGGSTATTRGPTRSAARRVGVGAREQQPAHLGCSGVPPRPIPCPTELTLPPLAPTKVEYRERVERRVPWQRTSARPQPTVRRWVG